MSIRTSPYFSNGADIEQGFQNLAQMFAPPASGDLANWSLARERNQRSDIIQKLAADPQYAGFDHQGILADLYDPTQSFYAVDTAAATSRSNNAADNARAIQTNAADNTTALALPRFSPLAPGEMIPAVDSTLAAQFGLPTGLGPVQGNPKPLSATELEAQNTARLIAEGDLTDQNLVSIAMGGVPVENVVTPDGPRMVPRDKAVGQEPYFNAGAEAKPENAVGPDGRPVIQGKDGAWYSAQTGEKLPDDAPIFKVPAPQGSASDVGLGKPAQNYIDRALIDLATARNTATTLRDLISKSPASQGAVGFLRGTAQDAIQVGGELGEFFGGGVADVARAIDEGLADASLAGNFDPNIPAIDMLANLLAFQYAKTTTGERLSNEMLKAARAALGLDGLDANQANSLARLDQAIAQIASQEEILKRAKGEGVDALSTPAGGGDAPEGWTPEEWGYLSAAEQEEYLNGN